jgi:hypothetical protein
MTMETILEISPEPVLRLSFIRRSNTLTRGLISGLSVRFQAFSAGRIPSPDRRLSLQFSSNVRFSW